MKLIIQQGHKKRDLIGSFNICASRADLEHLITQLQYVLQRPDDQMPFSYGWISIPEQVPPGPPNTPPEPWEMP